MFCFGKKIWQDLTENDKTGEQITQNTANDIYRKILKYGTVAFHAFSDEEFIEKLHNKIKTLTENLPNIHALREPDHRNLTEFKVRDVAFFVVVQGRGRFFINFLYFWGEGVVDLCFNGEKLLRL